MAAHQQQHPASAPAPASRKRPHAEHEEQAKRSRPLAELQADEARCTGCQHDGEQVWKEAEAERL